MRRQAQMRAARGQGYGVGREVSLPLPTNGIHVNGKNAEISNVYASELNNFRTDGIDLELRRSVSYGPGDEIALQRIPYEFGATPAYIELRFDRAQCLGAELMRPFYADAMVGYLSGTAILADGHGDPVSWNGTAFATSAFTTGTSVSPADLDGIVVHHDRVFLWKTGGDLEFYYGDVGAVTGALTRFPLGRLGNITGRLQMMMQVTMDAGQNSNDALCIFTTTGDVVIYEGLNPGDANDWNLVSRLRVAPPLTRYGTTRVGSDVWFLTANGVASILNTISQGVLALVSPFTRPIAADVRALVAAGGLEWGLHATADGSAVLINGYDPVAGTGTQFVYDSESQAWTTSDLPARFWHNLDLTTEFTHGDGRLGTVAAVQGGGESITARWATSWMRLGGGELAYIKPTIIAKGALAVTVTVLSNHDETASDIAEAVQAVTIQPDNTPDAGGGLVSLDEEIGVDAVGDSYKLIIEITAQWAKIVNLTAGVI
jgi:hypothetical protein